MAWKIEFAPGAFEELQALDREAQRRILRYLRECIATEEDPRRFGKPLRRELAGLWRYRIGDYRAICQIRDAGTLVTVLRVAHRRLAYS